MRRQDELQDDKTYGLLGLDAVGVGGHLDGLAGLLGDGRHFDLGAKSVQDSHTR